MSQWPRRKPIEVEIQRSSSTPPSPTQETLYPCDTCPTMRTKAEGGTTFTICDACWDKKYPKRAAPPSSPETPAELTEALDELEQVNATFRSGHSDHVAARLAARSALLSLYTRQREEIKELIEQLVEDTRQLERLKADSERLDWLQDYRDGFYNIDRISADRKGFNGLQSIRSAIDALRLRSEGANG